MCTYVCSKCAILRPAVIWTVLPSLYVMGTLIAVLLACIAGLLCFGICVLPVLRQAQTKKYNFGGQVDEQL